MEGIKTIGISICVVLVITSIFSMLMPSEKLGKVLKLTLSLFFIASIITPIASGEVKFNLTLPKESKAVQYQMDLYANESFVSLAQTNLENSLMRILEQKGLAVQKVKVSINKIGKDNISISEVLITASSELDEKQIKSVVKQEIGVEPELKTTLKKGEYLNGGKAW